MNKRICLLDLNYTLVANQAETRLLRPFSKRLEAEEYRTDLIEVIKYDFVIIITARPEKQKTESLANILRKTGWQPHDAYFNDLVGDNPQIQPPEVKKSILERFIFPKYGKDHNKYYAVESNPLTRAMYSEFRIVATKYDDFILQSK
jgi:hypothetical protein